MRCSVFFPFPLIKKMRWLGGGGLIFLKSRAHFILSSSQISAAEPAGNI